jgi:transcription elongation factor GreA
MEGEVPVTKEEFAEIEQEIEKLKEESKKLSTEIARARDLGDLAENAEYHAAREQKAMVDAKTAQLKEKLTSFKIVEKKADNGTVQFGSVVTLHDLRFNEDIECRIVGGSQGSNPNEISVSSPVGKALLDKKVGETVEVAAPKGMIKFKVLKIRN